MEKGWLKRNWWWLTIIGLAAIALLVCLGLQYGIAISFAVLSIFVATFFAARSLKVTRDSLNTTRQSLELSRATTRPFLNVSVPKSTLFQSELRLVICNTGALPADKVEILCTLRTMENEEVIKEYELPTWNKAPSIYFPGDEVGPVYRWTPTECDFANNNMREKTLIRVTIDYRNRLTQEAHTTTRIFVAKESNIYAQYLLEPIPRYDAWDEQPK
jgi:hypothetical protein